MKFSPRTKRTLRNVLASLLLAAPVLGANTAGAGVLAQYNFNSTTTPLNASTVGAGITASAITTSATGFGAWWYHGEYGAQTAALTDVELHGGGNNGDALTLSGAVADNQSLSFTISSAQAMNLSSLTFDGVIGQFQPPAGYGVATSVGGQTTIISSAAFTAYSPSPAITYTIDLSGAQYQGLHSISIWVYGYNTGASGVSAYDNITVNGYVGAPVSAANTTISASPASITANGTSTSTLTVQTKDVNNGNFSSSGGIVTLSTTAGSLSAVADNQDGTYSATLTSSTTARIASITGTLGGATIGNPTSVTFTPGPVNAANTTISASPSSIAADGSSASTLTVQARDVNNNYLTSSGGTVTLSATTGSLSGVTDNGNGTYTATLTSSATPSTASITGTISGAAIGHSASVTFAGPLVAANTTISANPASITANGTTTSTLTVQAKDANNSNLASSSGTVILSATDGSLSAVTDNLDGTYTATLTSSTTPGTVSIIGTIGGETIGHPASVLFERPVSAANTTIIANPSSITADGTSTLTLTVQAKAADGSNLTSSSGTVTLNASAGTLGAVTDNLDGTYTATLTAPGTPGSASITGTIGGNAIGHWALVTFTAAPGVLQLTRAEVVPTGTHIVWNASPLQSYSVLTSSSLLTSFTNWSPTSVNVAGDFIDTNSRAGVPQMFYRVKENINPNHRISIGKPTAGYTVRSQNVTSGMDDGIFDTFLTTWDGGYPTPAAPSWVAINIGQGPTRVLLEWDAGGNYNYQETDYGGPGNYAIYTSPDSTTGADGTWTQVASVTNNIYRTRSHSFDFTGMKWVKMVITAAPANSLNGAQMDEIEVYDISAASSRGRRAEDTWFFMGDSITAHWADRGTATGTNDPASHQPSFAALVNIANSNYFPSMINGGIGGETSAGGLARLAQNLADNPDYYYWALCYGANDGNTESLRANLQSMVDMLRANGRVPVIPHVAYSTLGRDYYTNFNAMIDQLVATNHIIAGPDCYSFFLAHTNQLIDGLHPTDEGMRSYNLLWFQAMRHLYP